MEYKLCVKEQIETYITVEAESYNEACDKVTDMMDEIYFEPQVPTRFIEEAKER